MRKRRISSAGQYEINFDDPSDFKVISPEYPQGKETVARNSEASVTDDFIYFMSFGSGSSGNCYYIGNHYEGILIDGGLPPSYFAPILKSQGVDMGKVKALLLTHDHGDHTRYVYNILRKHKHIRLLCTNRVIHGLLKRHNVSSRIRDYHTAIFKEIPFKVGRFEITAFEVPHDGTDNMGFNISYSGRNFVIATDMGSIKSRARYYISQANYLIIEANYDLQMLLHGTYPDYLKARIQTENGHMDNLHTAEFLKEIAGGGLQYIFLCHLSKENNTPQKALEAVKTALEEKGLIVGGCEDTLEDRNSDIRLMALPRQESSRWFVFRH